MDTTNVPGTRIGVANATDLDDDTLLRDPEVSTLTRQLSSWVDGTRNYGKGQKFNGSIFDRTMFLPSQNPYDKIRSARCAVREDDVIGGAAEITAGVAFKGGMHWESPDPEVADLFNQVSADLDLDKFLLQMWTEDFSIEQAVVAKMWDWRTYKVRGVTKNGNLRKKTFKIWCPVRLVMLNSAQVVPVGWGPLREDRLAWQSTPYEIGEYDFASNSGGATDPLMTRFYKGRYIPTEPLEQVRLGQWRVESTRLLEMNSDWVFRHAPRRPDYEMFANMAIESTFPQLDLKRQLMLRDRTMLVGAAQYILLIKKGTPDSPATKPELDNLRRGYHTLARVPLIVSDHRLEIEIIAPKQDFTLGREPYEVLNEQILARMMRAFVAPAKGGSGTQTGGAPSFLELLASTMELRRRMLTRTLERELARAIFSHPRNVSAGLGAPPSLAWKPGGVKVGVDQAVLQALLALRTQNEISRETILQMLDLDQSVEAQWRTYEADAYDMIFKTQVPFTAAPPDPNTDPGPGDSPAVTPNETPEAPAVSGRRGGRPPGGGTSPNSPGATAKPKTPSGNPSTKGI